MSCQDHTFVLRTLEATRDPSDLETRLRSNHHPSTLEITQITHLVADMKADVVRCDDELARLHSLIISIGNRRDELMGLIDSHNSLLAPIRRLPAELLINIFFHACGMNEIGSWSAPPDQPPFPTLLALGAVSVYWRQIILSTPSLWATISIGFLGHDKWTQSQMRIVEMYLQRSAQSPLTIVIEDQGSGKEERECLILESLIPHSNRWLDITMDLCEGVVRSEMFATLLGSLPMLKRLDFDVEIEDGEEELDEEIFESIPRLQTLALGSMVKGMVFPWEQVVHLTRRHVRVKDMLRSLMICPNLETLQVEHTQEDSDEEDSEEEDSDDDDDDDEIEVIRPVMSNLGAITLDIDDCFGSSGFGVLSAFLEDVTLPSIKYMTITSLTFGTSGKWPQDVFISFLSRSSCCLTTLSLSQIPIPDTDLIVLLGLLPSLSSLSIRDSPKLEQPNTPIPRTITDTLLKSLITHPSRPYDSSRQSLLPNLRSIDLFACGSSFSDQCFMDMVKSRWVAPADTMHGRTRAACLRVVVLRVVGRRFDRVSFEPLRYLEKAGMQVSVFDKKGRVK